MTQYEALADPDTVMLIRKDFKVRSLQAFVNFCQAQGWAGTFMQPTADGEWLRVYIPGEKDSREKVTE
ncbi:hypothetical protein [Bifidobacterium tibiigranuli]|jgi:hypothetical protein|nr:hypothetical protein [Bifidobacterium tibiigranuli]MCI1211029.1 hypothetical protein [Bifidobacterium tibiigranuli]MCI1221794.1 hypothetical protein [Bifidobacterium tibiigranuli]